MNERILLVEDEQALCMTLGDRICCEGYELEFAHDGLTAFRKIAMEAFDLVIVDLMLPLKSGLELCAELRQADITTPILVLTAMSHTIDKIAAFKLGADDYVTKPFDTLELLARIKALLRRSSLKPVTAASASAPRVVRVENAMFDIRRKQVKHNGQIVSLTTREFQLLWYLLERRGTTVSRDELLEQVWGLVPGTMTRTVDMHIATLRQKLGRTSTNTDVIVTVPGRGYQYQP